MKKLIPFILSYILVAVGIATFGHYFRHTGLNSRVPPNSVTVITTLSHDELAAKLHQIGLSESHIQTMTEKPAPLLSLVVNFVLYGIYFAAFARLAHFFQRAFHANIPSREHIA
jgi:hypothetical protein